MSDPRRTNEQQPAEPASPVAPPAPKRPYHPPHLIVYGDVRDLTMGVSPGIGESGNPALFRV